MKSILLAILLSGYALYGQEVDIKKIYTESSNVVLEYDLKDESLSNTYTLKLYSSKDNFIQPLENVSGDIGVDIEVGGNKKLIWNVREEFGDDYDGIVSLELKGKVYVPFVTFNDFQDYDHFKRDRSYVLTWAAGRGSSVTTWDLYNRKDEKVYTFPNVANVGEYEMTIPKEVRPGKGYRFKITDKNNKDDVVYTPKFTIKRKIPIFLTGIIAGAIITGVAVLVSSSGEGTTPAGESPIADPTLPTN